MNPSVLILCLLSLRIYPVKADKKADLLAKQKSSYEKLIRDPTVDQNHDTLFLNGPNKPESRRSEYVAGFVDAKKDQLNQNNVAKRVKKGKLHNIA